MDQCRVNSGVYSSCSSVARPVTQYYLVIQLQPYENTCSIYNGVLILGSILQYETCAWAHGI